MSYKIQKGLTFSHLNDKLKYLLVFILFLSIDKGYGQNEDNPDIDTTIIEKYKQTKPISYIIKTNLLPAIYSKLPLSAEYRLLGEFAITPKQSLSVGASYIGKTFLYDLITTANGSGQAIYIYGYRIQLGYKYYLIQKKMRPSGLFLSPHLSYYSAEYYYEPKGPNVDYDKLTNYTAHLFFGAQIILKDIATFEFFSGLGYSKYTYTQYSYINNTKRTTKHNPADFGGLSNLSPISFVPIGFNFGLAF